MNKEKRLEEKIEKLERENDILRRDNRYLKKLVNSKRFKFAEKIATGYNGVFPKNTKRRNAMERIGTIGKKAIEKRGIRREKKIAQKVNKLAEGYQKIIVLNSVPFDLKLKQRPHHLAEEFSKLGYFVVYLEYDNVIESFRIIKKNLITVNTERFLDGLPQICKRCYFLSPNNMPTNYSILKREKDLGYEIIYDYLDEFHEDISGDLSIQMGVWDKLPELRPILCLATAERLYNEIRKHVGKKQTIVMARNAVDVGHFDFEKNNYKSVPMDLKNIVQKKKPIIGFYGALAPWIDFNMLNKLADKRKEWEFVYLGVDYNGAAKDLIIKDNVHNLGAKNYDNLPKYAKYFNAAIIPFKKGEIAKATSPVKLFEYMAAGLPTVCTKDLQECKGYKYVYIAADDDEFEGDLSRAIEDHKNKKSRKELLLQAIDNTWARRAQIIDENLNKLVEEKK